MHNKLLEEDLCTQCGLCCSTFHTIGFILNDQEKKTVQEFGGEIYSGINGQLEFKQPCPAFNGKCSVYPNHPQSCKDYHCSLLRALSTNKISYQKAQNIVQQTKNTVQSIDNLLFPILGNRTTILEEYIEKLLTLTQNNKKLINDVLPSFGAYKFLRQKYFD